jgi:hypothetical protein
MTSFAHSSAAAVPPPASGVSSVQLTESSQVLPSIVIPAITPVVVNDTCSSWME